MTSAAKRLLVNADDLGWSRSVNDGIIEAHRDGIVTSTSVLAAGSAFEHAVESLASSPDLSVGVHLNIYRGVPVLPASRVATLLGPDGSFPGNWRITIRRLATGSIDLAQVEAEFSAAVERVMEAGITPRHLDSEKHLHHWPPVFDCVCRVARRYDIPRVRVVREPFAPSMIPMGLSALGQRNARVARSFGLSVAEATVGVTRAPISAKDLREILGTVPKGAGDVEFVCHPGRIDAEFMALQAKVSNRLVESRELELAALTGPEARESVRAAGCTLCSSF